MIRALVITRDDAMTESITEHFKPMEEEFQVQSAHDAEEGIKLFEDDGVGFDLLIAEVGNAELDGTNLVLELRRRSPSMPCIALASNGETDPETREFLENQGILRFLEQPIEMEELNRRINEVLDEARSLGFQGHLQRISLIDVIQLYCGSGKIGRLDFIHWGKRGAIYFGDGKLLHAVQDELEGQEAFYRLVGWDSGTFRVEFGVLPSVDTMSHESLNGLLIEAIRRQDEAHLKNGSEAPTRVETPARLRGQVGHHGSGQGTPPQLEMEESESSPRRRQPVLKAGLVNDLLDIDGVEGLIVVNRNGVVLQTEDVDESEETLGTLTAFVGSSCEAAQRTLGADRFTSALVVERGQRKLLVVNTRNFFIGVIGSTHVQVDGLTTDVLNSIRRAASAGKVNRGRRQKPPALTTSQLPGAAGDPDPTEADS